jgi:hypothetical protein
MLVHRKHNQVGMMTLQKTERRLDRIVARSDYLDDVDAKLSTWLDASTRVRCICSDMIPLLDR